MIRHVTSLVLVGTFAAAPLAGQARPALADSVRALLEAATITGDRAQLRAGAALAERALDAGGDEALLTYWMAYAAYREAQRERSDASTALLERAATLLERSQGRRKSAETQALLGSVYGSLAGGGMMAGMRYGPKASATLDAAERAAPRNPRVLLLQAISAYYTPRMWGGGLDKAERFLERAEEAFAADRPAPGEPAWGRAELHAYRGMVLAKQGKIDAARAAFEQALAVAPEYTWVRRVLLPALASR